MNLLTKKKRIFFFVMLIVSIAIMLFFNINDHLEENEYSNRLNIISLIFITAFALLLYIIFEGYKIMYDEMTERVNIITANKNDLQSIYNSISMLLIEVDMEGIIININDSVCNYLHRKRNHIIGKTIPKVFPIDTASIDVIEDMIKDSLKENTGIKKEIETETNVFEVSVTVSQEFPESEKKVLIILNDVTQERANYRQMMQDNKMIAVGHLAAGVAHEIRNPLGLIRTYCHLLKNRSDDPLVREKAIPMIDYAVDRSSAIIDNLLGFSRLSSETWEEVDLLSIMEMVISLEEHESQNRRIDITIECPSGLKLYTIAESLQIIIVNLVSNAIAAVEENGSVSIRCNENEEQVDITVNDTGVGIPEEIKHDIFNPFFTTKRNGTGNGLGLYIVYNEVSKLKGKIEVESGDGGKGTSFVVSFNKKVGIQNG